MKTYSVRIPITGIADLEVEAENEQAAIEKAMNEVKQEDITEWNPHEIIVQGNVFYGHTNEAEAEEV